MDRDAVNRACGATDKYTFGGCWPRPFEQLQFLRGTANLYMDLTDPPPAMRAFMALMHDFYCELLTVWAKTDVDGLHFMDDWGSQRALLVAPAMWRTIFKPMYRDYAQIAHSAGKRLFMHSDGHILAILPDLIEIGVDALNSQLFCMGVERLAPFAGQITFWGEIDRQHLLAHASTAAVAAQQYARFMSCSGGTAAVLPSASLAQGRDRKMCAQCSRHGPVSLVAHKVTSCVFRAACCVFVCYATRSTQHGHAHATRNTHHGHKESDYATT